MALVTSPTRDFDLNRPRGPLEPFEHGSVCAWSWAPLFQILDLWISYLDLGPALLLWACLLIWTLSHPQRTAISRPEMLISAWGCAPAHTTPALTWYHAWFLIYWGAGGLFCSPAQQLDSLSHSCVLLCSNHRTCYWLSSTLKDRIKIDALAVQTF